MKKPFKTRANTGLITLKNGEVIIYGFHAADAALKNPKRTIKQIYCSHKRAEEIKKIANASVPIKICDSHELDKMLPYDTPHQGIILICDTIFHSNLTPINFENANEKIAILDQITDPHNIGSIIRSAAAFNIQNIILQDKNSPDESGTIAKVASGALEIVNIIKVTNIKYTLDHLKQKGFWVIALDSNTENLIDKTTLKGKTALILGAEGKGIRPLILKNSDFICKLPINKMMPSLNVSNAAAIAFYEIHNQSDT